MKKILSVLLVLAALLALATSAALAAEVALVTDVGTIDDESFNQACWEGVESLCRGQRQDLSVLSAWRLTAPTSA